MPWATRSRAQRKVSFHIEHAKFHTDQSTAKKLTYSELRKKKKDRMARRKRGEEV